MYEKSDKIRRQLGENIKKLRMSRGYTQDKFGKACGKRQAVISSWEVGIRQPELDVIFEVAEAFHVPISSLIPIEASGTDEDITISIAEMIQMDPRYRLLFEKAKKADLNKLDAVLSVLDAIAVEPDTDDE